MSPEAEAVIDRLEGTRDRWQVFSLLSGVVASLTISAGTLLVFVVVDVLIPLPQSAIVVMSALWLVLTTTLLVTVIRRLLRSQRSLEATARRMELDWPELGSDLINIVQLAGSNQGEPHGFRRAAVTNAASRLQSFSFETASARKTRWRRFVECLQSPRDLAEACAALLFTLALGFILHHSLARWPSSVQRLLCPWTFVPAAGSVRILGVTPGNTDVLAGTSLEIAAEIENLTGQTHRATLYVVRENEPESSQPLLPDPERRRYAASFASILKPMRYRIEIGDSQTPYYSVGIVQKPIVEEVAITYRYPDYLRLENETVRQNHGDLNAPQYTVAELTFVASTTIQDGWLLMDSSRVGGLVSSDGRSLLARLLLTKNTQYTVHLLSEYGHGDPDPRINTIEVIPDSAPTVQLLKPPRESTVARGGEIATLVQASDDHGLAEVRLEMKAVGEDGLESAPRVAATATDLDGGRTATLRHTLHLESLQLPADQDMLVRAVAVDRRHFLSADGKTKLGQQESATAWHAVRVVEADVKSTETLAQLDAVRAALWKILEKQVRARVSTAELSRGLSAMPRDGSKSPDDPSENRGAVLSGGDCDPVQGSQVIRSHQVEIQQATVKVVEEIGPSSSEDRVILKRALTNLAFGHMLDAVRLSEALAANSAPDSFGTGATALGEVQDLIIDFLRRLLDATRRATAETLAEMEQRPAGDLPADVQDKLRELKSKLDEFLKQQRKVIEASESLAKMPVDDFTEKEEQLLKELAASEDEWSRFLKDFHSDLSKLPEQDFSNPSLLEELIEVQTELKMAEDALTKKALDIAVPLEQLGAEMAEELTTNIEKWLPDTPDRERWSQEEPITDDMKKAPMAELPGELEDLIGELMEQEEDLFEEMEDLSSSWADSIDKGAGWDAMDGPISNMSAKGVTGNRLPNTSEIGGRSGEGRSGKSSGEFVGDTAVGKGGRKTPSRLTPDPFMKGQVKDFSKDPTGGATGGGKESGQGGQGLEGPVPNRPERDLERLANKQATLRNKAEGIDLQFQIMNYHHSDLKRLIEAMATVERDLRTGRYRNAIRQRDILLDGLGRVKEQAAGEFSVRQDNTTNLPTDVQKEILGSMHEPVPEGWEILNRQYFERLSSSKNTEKAKSREDPLP